MAVACLAGKEWSPALSALKVCHMTFLTECLDLRLPPEKDVRTTPEVYIGSLRIAAFGLRYQPPPVRIAEGSLRRSLL